MILFSFRSFIVLGVTFRSVIHLELVFWIWYKISIEVHHFILLYKDFITIYSKNYSFSTDLPLYFFFKKQSSRNV